MSALTVGSLFSGIGGFDLGLERAGMRPLWMCEIDQACQGVLRRHWPGVNVYGDVTRLSADNVVRPDVLCGGFPCQDVSVAGRRAGLAGERSGLWFEFHRLIGSLQPRWVVIENVPGLLSSNGGQDFAVVLRGLVECGYGVAWRVLDAQYFGVAQRRRRVFIVGSLGSGRAAEVLFEREGVSGDTPPRREAGQRVAGTLTAGAHPDGFNGRDAESGLFVYGGISGQPLDASMSLNAHPGGRWDLESENFVVSGFGESGQGWWRDGVGPLRAEGENRPSRPSSVIAFRTNQTNAQGPIHSVEITDTLAQDHPPAVATFDPIQVTSKANRTRVEFGAPCNTLHEKGMSAIGGFGVRRLTPVECERLQGFPDGWTAGQSDSTRYRQLGNAVCVNVAEWIGRRIMEADTA